MAKELIIYCDESISRGSVFSDFYGGLLIYSTDLAHVQNVIALQKQNLNLLGEVKWQKVTENYLEKYIQLMNVFFDFIASGKIKVRIMFRQNMHTPKGLPQEKNDEKYFKLYYQFIKHSFGLKFCNPELEHTSIRLYLDELPENREKRERFKDFIVGLNTSYLSETNTKFDKSQIAEVDSSKHDLLQCLDVVLGSMQFRLNKKHLEKIPGTRRRGKRTIAKEKLYKYINSRIRDIYPNFNIGVSTGKGDSWENIWQHEYRHWLFVPSSYAARENDDSDD